ncbi:MAG: hypothetical protein U1E53_22985 [Dongiaceae bacterium]
MPPMESLRLRPFLAILLIAGLGTLGAGRTRATPLDITYVATPCGGAFAACTIAPAVRSPTPDQLAGLDDAAIVAYLQAQSISGVDPAGHFGISITDSSADYVVGSLFGPNLIATQFVYGAAGLICCVADTPFAIRDINDNDIVVGFNNGPFVAAIGPSSGYASRAIILNPEVLDSLPHTTFLAVDDTNSILARRFGQDYELHPVPEPPALALFCAGLVMVLWTARSCPGRRLRLRPPRSGS